MPANERRWSGRVVLLPGRLLFLGPGARADRHAHHAVQIALGLDADVRVSMRGSTIEGRAVVIPADVEHELDALGGRVAFLFVEPEGPRGRVLQAEALRRGAELAERLYAIDPPPADDADSGQVVAWIEALLDCLTPRSRPSAPLHPAIQTVLASLRERVAEGVPRVTELAAEVGLSPTRLTHVFSEQVGIPLRAYLLWLRLELAASEVRRGANLTEAAHAAGFSDAAHLSRTFKASYGIPPSQVLPTLAFTEVPEPR